MRKLLEQWIDEDDVDLDCWEDCQKLMYVVDHNVRDAYMDELETVIQF